MLWQRVRHEGVTHTHPFNVFSLRHCVSFRGTANVFSDTFSYIYMCMHTYIEIILFQILFHDRLLQDVEYSSLRYTVGPCCLPVLYI